MDTNKDGVVDETEFTSTGGSKAEFKHFDKNSDGVLDAGELSVRTAAKQRARKTMERRAQVSSSLRSGEESEALMVSWKKGRAAPEGLMEASVAAISGEGQEPMIATAESEDAAALTAAKALP